jgi:hypothetical protein
MKLRNKFETETSGGVATALAFAVAFAAVGGALGLAAPTLDPSVADRDGGQIEIGAMVTVAMHENSDTNAEETGALIGGVSGTAMLTGGGAYAGSTAATAAGLSATAALTGVATLGTAGIGLA